MQNNHVELTKMASSFRFNFPENTDYNSSQEGIAAIETHDAYRSEQHSNYRTTKLDIAFEEHGTLPDYLRDVTCITSMKPFSSYELKLTDQENVRELFYLSNQAVSRLIEERKSDRTNRLTLSDVTRHSDLNSGVYEGGLKVWECSFDLVDFLQNYSPSLHGKDVLELGCGAGLPGIYCLLSGSKFVCYQDFNEEVIDLFTIPNVLYNSLKAKGVEWLTGLEKNDNFLSDVKKKNMFLSGDWESGIGYFQKASMMFDVILSSETIYNPAYYPGLHKIICSCLKRDGFALIASKTYYFGVGGGTKDFIDFVTEKGDLKIDIVATIKGGVNREILKLEWRKL